MTANGSEEFEGTVPSRARRAAAWCQANERELVLAWLGFIAGFCSGRVAGRHEK